MEPTFIPVHPLAHAVMVTEAAELRYIASVESWGPEEYAAKRPLEAARIAARRAWTEAGCPVESTEK